VWLLLVTDQQLTLCACSVIAAHAQILPDFNKSKENTDIAVHNRNYHTATGNHMPYGITQCYLQPGSGDFPAFTPAEAGTRFSDPGGMLGCVNLTLFDKTLLPAKAEVQERLFFVEDVKTTAVPLFKPHTTLSPFTVTSHHSFSTLL